MRIRPILNDNQNPAHAENELNPPRVERDRRRSLRLVGLACLGKSDRAGDGNPFHHGRAVRLGARRLSNLGCLSPAERDLGAADLPLATVGRKRSPVVIAGADLAYCGCD